MLTNTYSFIVRLFWVSKLSWVSRIHMTSGFRLIVNLSNLLVCLDLTPWHSMKGLIIVAWGLPLINRFVGASRYLYNKLYIMAKCEVSDKSTLWKGDGYSGTARIAISP